MSDWVGLGIIILVAGGGFYALMKANEPRELTEEEFERRAHESRGLAGAGFSALQQVLDPSTKRAEAVIEDMRQGYYDGEQESGDGNDTSVEGKSQNEKLKSADTPKGVNHIEESKP